MWVTCWGDVCISPVDVDFLGDGGGVVWVPSACEVVLSAVCVAVVVPVGPGSLGDIWMLFILF